LGSSEHANTSRKENRPCELSRRKCFFCYPLANSNKILKTIMTERFSRWLKNHRNRASADGASSILS
jgi:hypothetical protein